MERKALDWGILFMSVILKQPDDRLCRTDITALQVCTDLVVLLGCRKTDRCLVSAFVNILVDGFAGLDGGANLNVDVGVVLEAEITSWLLILRVTDWPLSWRGQTE